MFEQQDYSLNYSEQNNQSFQLLSANIALLCKKDLNSKV